MTEHENKLKFEFMPGAFDAFEGTQEELDAFIAAIMEQLNTVDLSEYGEPEDGTIMLQVIPTAGLFNSDNIMNAFDPTDRKKRLN